MQYNTPFSLSIQREIEKRHLNLESEINKSMNDLGIKTLLHRTGIEKCKGYPTVTLLYVLILLPIIKESLSALWSGKFFDDFVKAHKDTYYRFLNRVHFNWRKLITLLATRAIARLDQTPFKEKVLVVDDSLLPKTGENMELVSYHFDHKTKHSQLGYQMLQLGYHNGTHFYPLDLAFHTSERRPNHKLREIDRRTNGWKRRLEAFEKKTNVLVEMISRCWQAGVNARFVLFDSWFAHDKVISKIVSIGYGVICRLKRGKTRYQHNDQSLTLSQLWHEVARHQLRWINTWQIKATYLDVSLPLSGKVRIVFVRWNKKNWHAFLCSEPDLEIYEILNYYARRWSIEVYFRDCKQLLALGKGQSETFDAIVAWVSIVMIRYLLLVYILAKRQITGPIGPLFQELAYEHLQIAVIHSLWTRIREIFMLSSQLLWADSESENILYLIDLVEDSILGCNPKACAKL